MTAHYKMRLSVASAVLAGLALRLLFILRFPMGDSGDAPLYIALARNWLAHGIYAISIHGVLAPVDIRGPGYPAFLAAIFALFGNSQLAVMLAQAALDLATCFLIALIAARLAPAASRRRVALAGLWLAALCPFTANYTAVAQTETLAIFLTALAILLLLQTEIAATPVLQGDAARPVILPWFLAGVVAGLGALVRPETPLILLAAGLVIAWRWRRPADWPKLLRSAALLAAGLLLALLPWAARNRATLHEVQFLTPRYSELPGEIAPRGFDAWTATWLWRMRDVYLISWNLESDEIPMSELPPSAFDSPAERTQVAGLFAKYNDTLTLDSDMNDAFGRIARARTRRHPLRTYAQIPFLRSLTMWFSPRIELLPVSGDLFPLRRAWREDRADFLVTLSAIVMGCFYVLLGAAGAWRARLQSGCAFLILFLVVRTAFFAECAETPEPRYVLECFPALLAFAAQLWRQSPATSGMAASPRE